MKSTLNHYQPDEHPNLKLKFLLLGLFLLSKFEEDLLKGGHRYSITVDPLGVLKPMASLRTLVELYLSSG